MQAIIDEADKPKKGGQNEPLAPKRRKFKNPTRKTKSPTLSKIEHSQSDTQSEICNEEEEPVRNEEEEPVHNEDEELVHNEGVTSNPESIIPLFIPLFTNSIAPPTTSETPLVSVNAYDAGAGASGFTYTHISPPISPLSEDDSYTIYRDGEDNLAGFTFIPFTIKTEIKSLVKTLTKEHTTNIEKMNKAVNDSTDVFNKTTEKVDKLISDAIVFMNNFQTSFESNTAKANEAISNIGSSLKAEREKLQEVRAGITSDHEEFKSPLLLKFPSFKKI
ncbi:unnamed protein product [Lactuca saligna]|uniref:Uncharacterized protein n=1 Tax=Lactuca saligna TaxID=75948 RepID=A0AA35ZZL0_LACSI|nr:unnamed protein product [Lactuca saligna]